MSRLTNVSCIYTGGNIYTYQALYKGKYWVYGSLDGWLNAYSYEPFKYGEETNSTEAPEEYAVVTDDMPTWRMVLNSLKQPDALIGGSVDECIDIIKEFQVLSNRVDQD